jgi:nucleoside-diphosphate kinase
VCARALRVTGAADDKTRRMFATTRGAAVLLVQPGAYAAAGQVLTAVYAAAAAGGGLAVGRLRTLRLSPAGAAEFLALGASATAADSLVGDNCLAIEVVGEDVVARLHELAGPADPADARAAAPTSLRAVFGKSRANNAIHVSADAATAKAEVAYVFDRAYPQTSVATHCSAVVVKPHAVAAAAAGAVFDALVSAGLEVSAVRSTALTRSDAADFLEVYRTVVPEYERWVRELSSGPCVALEVRGEGAVGAVRDLAGPFDPTVARELRPDTLRARFGVDNVRNGLHVTDIDRDGPLECKFLFTVV